MKKEEHKKKNIKEERPSDMSFVNFNETNDLRKDLKEFEFKRYANFSHDQGEEPELESMDYSGFFKDLDFLENGVTKDLEKLRKEFEQAEQSNVLTNNNQNIRIKEEQPESKAIFDSFMLPVQYRDIKIFEKAEEEIDKERQLEETKGSSSKNLFKMFLEPINSRVLLPKYEKIEKLGNSPKVVKRDINK